MELIEKKTKRLSGLSTLYKTKGLQIPLQPTDPPTSRTPMRSHSSAPSRMVGGLERNLKK